MGNTLATGSVNSTAWSVNSMAGGDSEDAVDIDVDTADEQGWTILTEKPISAMCEHTDARTICDGSGVCGHDSAYILVEDSASCVGNQEGTSATIEAPRSRAADIIGLLEIRRQQEITSCIRTKELMARAFAPEQVLVDELRRESARRVGGLTMSRATRRTQEWVLYFLALERSRQQSYTKSIEEVAPFCPEDSYPEVIQFGEEDDVEAISDDNASDVYPDDSASCVGIFGPNGGRQHDKHHEVDEFDQHDKHHEDGHHDEIDEWEIYPDDSASCLGKKH